MFGAVPSPRTNFRNEIFVNVCVRAVRICCSCFVFDRLILYLCRAGEQMLPFISCAGWQIWPRVCMHAKCINLHFALWWNKCFLQRSVIFSNAGVRAIAELFRIAICKCDSILYKLNSNAVFFLCLLMVLMAWQIENEICGSMAIFMHNIKMTEWILMLRQILKKRIQFNTNVRSNESAICQY